MKKNYFLRIKIDNLGIKFKAHLTTLTVRVILRKGLIKESINPFYISSKKLLIKMKWSVFILY